MLLIITEVVYLALSSSGMKVQIVGLPKKED